MAEQQMIAFGNDQLGADTAAGVLPKAPFHPATRRVLSLSSLSAPLTRGFANSLFGSQSVVSIIAAKVLYNRGITTKAAADSLLQNGLTDLPNPSLLKSFDRAAEKLSQAIISGSRIALVGDYDVDGITAVAQTVQTLQLTHSDHRYWIPNRFKDGYGISDRIVEQIIADQCKLVCLFDHGSHAFEQIAKLQRHGIEVLVFDHHTVGPTLPPGATVVNPRQPGCGLSSEFPCAAGLSYLLNKRVRELLSGDATRFSNLPTPDLSLAALGTVADMVPLTGFNRTVTRLGLLDIRRDANPGLSTLAHLMGVLPSDLTSMDISFRCGPALNAMGRMNDAAVCVELLTTSDRARPTTIANELVECNQARKELQSSSLRDDYRRLANLRAIPGVLVSYAAEHHPGINGLLASGLANRHVRPAFVMAKSEDGSFTGSARSGDQSYDLMRILTRTKELDTNGVILRAGGHPAAAGISVKAEGLPEFTSLVNSAFREIYTKPLEEVQVKADAILTFRSLTASFVRSLDSILEPYGQGFAAPQFLFKKATVSAIHETERGRVQLQLTQSGRTISAEMGPEIWNNDLAVGSILDVIASPARIWRRTGRSSSITETVQLSLAAYSVVGAADIQQEKATPTATENETTPPPITDLSSERLLLTDAPAADKATITPAPGEKRSKPKRKTRGESKFEALKRELREVASRFDSRYIYPDLHDPDPLIYRPPEYDLQKWRTEMVTSDLAFNFAGAAYRPAQIEAIRYGLRRDGNMLLRAPTNSGKTFVAIAQASHYRKHNRRVIFLAPTKEIVRQVAQDFERLLGETPLVLDGELTGPKERASLYQTRNPRLIIATPGVIARDIKRGRLTLEASDFLVIDEGHHSTGNYPSVPVIRAARAVGAKQLLMSATPAESLEKLDQLKRLLGVDNPFPMNVEIARPDLKYIFLQLTEGMAKADAELSANIQSLRARLLDFAETNGLSRIKTLVSEAFKHSTDRGPSHDQLRRLREAIRESDCDQKWRGYRLARAAGELSLLQDTLRYTGVAGFLLRCIEKHCEVAYPKELRGKQRFLTPPDYLAEVYTAPEVIRAYRAVAHGEAMPYWFSKAFKSIIGMPRTEWNNLSNSRRKSIFNRQVNLAKARIAESLATADYCDHPLEHDIASKLTREPLRAFICVKRREHAIFLASRLNFLLSEADRKAAALTGAGQGVRKGISPKEREQNLTAFNRGDATILDATSAGYEGLNIHADFGAAIDFDSSERKATQSQGRVGRHGSQNQFTYYCMSNQDYGKVLTILRKFIKVAEQRNAERAAITKEAGLPPLEDPEITLCFDLPRGPGGDTTRAPF